MPQTVPRGYEFESLAEEPGRTLNGGSDRSSPILAQQINDDVSGVAADVSGIDTRLTVVEGFGTPSWVKIDSGSVSNVATFVIGAIPTGVYRAVRIHLHGNNETTVDPIRIRFNDDSTADLHNFSYKTYDGDGTLQFFQFASSDFWDIAVWGTANSCSAEVTILNTHVTDSCSFQGRGSRIGGSITTQQETVSHGRLNAPRLLSSLRISGPPGANFSADWFLEGAPV